MQKLRTHYGGKKVYYQNWYKDSIRVAFRRYSEKLFQFEDTVKFFKKLTHGEIFPVNNFKKIHLRGFKRQWYIYIELPEEGWLEKEMESKGYSHPAEVLPEIKVIRNNVEIDPALLFNNRGITKEMYNIMSKDL